MIESAAVTLLACLYMGVCVAYLAWAFARMQAAYRDHRDYCRISARCQRSTPEVREQFYELLRMFCDDPEVLIYRLRVLEQSFERNPEDA